MSTIDNTIVVIGGNHHNTLGVIRSLGEKGCHIVAIITNDSPYAFVKKSKYIEKYYTIYEDEKEILNVLKKKINTKKEKPIIVPTSDFAARTIDENYNNLSKTFLLPSIGEEQGKIAEYMDKYEQYKIAVKHGLRMARSVIVDVNSTFETLGMKKCILKPIISADGVKSDIRLCNNSEEYMDALKHFNKKNYKSVLAQEIVDFDKECDLPGCACGGEVIIPGIMEKERIFPVKKGSTSFAHIKELPNNEFTTKLKKVIRELKYDGIFDVELFIKGNEYYLNEINFRNSGTSFAYCYDNVFVVYLWLLLKLGFDTSNERKRVNEEYYFVDERLERKGLFEGEISILEYIRTKKKAKARLLHNRKDIKPSIFKMLYAIKRRI